jgi:hypothetical protein
MRSSSEEGFVFKAHRLVISLNSRPRVIKKKKKSNTPRIPHTSGCEEIS